MNAAHRFWLWLVGPPPRDGRGRPVHVTFISGYPAALWSRVHKLPLDVHRRVRSRCEKITQIWSAPTVVFTLIAVAPWIALIFLPIGLGVIGLSGRWWGSLPQFAGQGAFLASVIWYSSRLTANVRIDALLDESICPACRYSIAGIQTASDGCTICPECGAAWKLPNRAEPPSP